MGLFFGITQLWQNGPFVIINQPTAIPASTTTNTIRMIFIIYMHCSWNVRCVVSSLQHFEFCLGLLVMP